MKIPSSSYAFIDGSYNIRTKVYGCGIILVDKDGIKHTIKKSDNKIDWAKMRNVAGEIMGSLEALSLAIDLGMKELTIFYDYEGIAKWPTHQWKTNNPITREYARKVNEYFKDIFLFSGGLT